MQQRAELRQLVLTSDQRRGRCGQVGSPDAGRIQWRKVGRQIGDDDLKDRLWAGQAFEMVNTQVTQGRVVGQLVAEDFLGRQREQNLSTMTSRQ